MPNLDKQARQDKVIREMSVADKAALETKVQELLRCAEQFRDRDNDPARVKPLASAADPSVLSDYIAFNVL